MLQPLGSSQVHQALCDACDCVRDGGAGAVPVAVVVAALGDDNGAVRAKGMFTCVAVPIG